MLRVAEIRKVELILVHCSSFINMLCSCACINIAMLLVEFIACSLTERRYLIIKFPQLSVNTACHDVTSHV